MNVEIINDIDCRWFDTGTPESLLDAGNFIEKTINSQKNQPQETLEHHIYTYLTRKYGVKHIVIEKAFSIFSSLRKYCNINSDVLLFAKIIRNDIDESSRDFSKEIRMNRS